ncbi:MAG: TonB-dependent receptor, partial [Pirellulaceae bacterium]|nr:TonB-dependent receptor [Pirellulaceae bacterium]
GYGHRTGNDYTMGNGQEIPTSYNSRDLDFALGFDLDEYRSLEFTYLRLDQTGVESPGQFFDINFLVTDAVELTYTVRDQVHFDRLSVEGWYNRTRFEGDAQRAGKRAQIPSIPLVSDNLETDVDSMSTGFSGAMSWGQDGETQLTLGSDMRFVKQELNELNDFSVDVDPFLAGILGIAPGVYDFMDANAPIPRSFWSNPGLFAELDVPATDRLSLRTGARVDFLSTDVTKDAPGLSSTLPSQVPLDRAFLTNHLRTDD